MSSNTQNSKTRNTGEKIGMLLIGMPHADSSFYEMNIAQLPQGPRIHFLERLFKVIGVSRETRRKIRMATGLENIFNPKRKTPYLGLRLIEQNLRGTLDITVNEYPESDQWIVTFLGNNKSVKILGISIGCENRVHHAKKLAKKIRLVRPDIRIIFGSYGASAGKKTGIITPEDGMVLWDSEDERVEKKKQGKDFYKGEGVHDTRLWLRESLGIDAGNPNAALISEAISDSGKHKGIGSSNWIKEFVGFVCMPKDSHKLVSAIGCSNNCDFCNTSKIFNREKTYLYQNAKKIFTPMEEVYDKNFEKYDFPPEATFFLMDENFMKDEKVKSPTGVINFLDVAEELCSCIEQSKKNIHFGTFSDIKSLVHIREKYGNFRKLVRGGITSIWIGIESREDAFGKRGDATPEMVREIVRELQSFGIVVIGSFIPGLAYHTEEATHQDKDGTFDYLNIWEDFQWWRELETGARQVMMHSITGIVGDHSHMFTLSDYEFGHTSLPGYNQSKIEGKRLEEIDEELREQFYKENGPVALSSLLVMWDGFMTLRDSDNEAEIRAATFNYWMAKRNKQRVVLASFLFNDRLFTRCSLRFLSRLAVMFRDVEIYSPPDTELNRKYQAVFEQYDSKNSGVSKSFAKRLCRKFVKKYTNYSE